MKVFDSGHTQLQFSDKCKHLRNNLLTATLASVFLMSCSNDGLDNQEPEEVTTIDNPVIALASALSAEVETSEAAQELIPGETSVLTLAAAQAIEEEVDVSEAILELASTEPPAMTLEAAQAIEIVTTEPTQEPGKDEEQILEAIDTGTAPEAEQTTPQELLEPVFSVKDLGLEEAMRQLTESKHGTLLFPSGTFEVQGISSSKTILNFDGYNDLMIVGQGDSTEIILTADNGHAFVKPIKITNSDNVIIKDLKIDGNKQLWTDLTGFYEHQSNIFIRYSSNIIIENISSYGAFGDAINVGDVSNTIIRNSRFDNTARNGITLGYGFSQNIEIDGNYFGSTIDTQQIDMEHGSYNNLVIRNNMFAKLLADDDDQIGVVIYGTDKAEVYDNIIKGTVLFRDASNVDFRDNIGISQLTLDRKSVDVSIRNNEFNLEPSNWGSSRNFPGIYLRPLSNLYPDRVTFKDNVIRSTNYSTVMVILDVANVSVEGNSFIIDDNVTETLSFIAREIAIQATVADNFVAPSPTAPQFLLAPDSRETNDKKITID